jgi:hypothetical protein
MLYARAGAYTILNEHPFGNARSRESSRFLAIPRQCPRHHGL